MSAPIFTDPTNPDPVELEILLAETEPNPGEPRPILDQYRTADDLAERAWADKAWTAICLAKTPETWQALREGRPVDRNALDPYYVAFFRTRGVVS
jgi:hypothetical protein